MDATTDEIHHKFTVDEVLAMVRAGILDEDDRVELIEGELLRMSPNDPPHAGPIGKLNTVLVRAYPEQVVRVQLDLKLSEHTLVEPDFVVPRGDPSEFDTRHPEGPDCILVIEVSWSSKRRDLRKIALYARAGVAVYWIVDVTARQLEVYERPLPTGQYARVSVLAETDEAALPDSSVRLRVGDILPRA